MDFRKVIRIFFIAFIILDLFLITSFFKEAGQFSQATTTTEGNSLNSLVKSMRNDQIQMKNLSHKTGTGYYIAAANDDYLRENVNQLEYSNWSYNDNTRQLEVSFATAIKLKSKEQPQKTLDTLVKDKTFVIAGKNYHYDAKLSSAKKIVYTQMVYGMPVHSRNGQLIFTIKNGYVQGYSQGYLSKVQILRQKKTTISELRAFAWLYQYNKVTSNTKLVWDELGYIKLLSVNGNTIYQPGWEFYLKNTTSGSYTSRTINAFTGAVIE